jgi:hypothetical protein
MNITNIENAKALKRMGLPLNTPVVEERTFSADYSRRWFALMKAHDDFCGALGNYVEAPSFPMWKRLRKSLNGIAREVKRADIAVGKLKDPNEQVILALFLRERAVPFGEYWTDALDAVEDGAALKITEANLRWIENE